MQRLSVVIITLNEEQHIGRCIQSVKSLADEIVVLDSGSCDRTVAIAKSLGAVVYHEKFRGHIEQKNLALQLASHDHILSLDADEMPDATLLASIRSAKKQLRGRAFSMNRCTSFCGRFLRHGLWYPDKKIRLFDRRIVKWGGMNPHDRIIPATNIKPVHLTGDLLHFAFASIEDQVTRNNFISTVAAGAMFESGKRSSWYKILVHPLWAFVNGYFLKRGFLDRSPGFFFAVNCAYQVFLKYTKLYRLQLSGPEKNSVRPSKILLPSNDIVNDDTRMRTMNAPQISTGR